MSARAVKKTDLLRVNRSKAIPLCEWHVVRMQVANVLARNCGTAGVQDTPKSLIGSFMGNVEPQSFAPLGQANRKASCGRSGLRCLKEAKALL